MNLIDFAIGAGAVFIVISSVWRFIKGNKKCGCCDNCSLCSDKKEK